MKRFILIILAIIMVLSFIACSGKTAEEDLLPEEIDDMFYPDELDELPEEEMLPEEETTPLDEIMSEEGFFEEEFFEEGFIEDEFLSEEEVDPESMSDSNQFEALLPPLPYDDWVFTGSSNPNEGTLTRINTADADDADAWDGQRLAFHDYVNALSDYDFTPDTTMDFDTTQVDAQDITGNHFTFQDLATEFQIHITLVQE